MEEQICDTPITGEYIAKHMKEKLGPHAILRSFEARKIAVGQGFVSTILRLRLTWETSPEDNLPATIIVKTPVVESLHKLFEVLTSPGADDQEKMKAAMAQMVTVIHKGECDFYELLGKSPPIAMPKYYVALPVTDDAPGMIILEDLSEKGSVIPSMLEGLTYPQLVSAVKELARLHAFSVTTSLDWRSKVATIEDREHLLKGIVDSLLTGFKSTKEQYPDYFGNLDVEKLTALSTFDKYVEAMNQHREFMDDVLTHGDVHANNILYEKLKDGTVGDRVIALIDFQITTRGSPAADIGRLFSFSVTHEVRRKHYNDVLHAYYDEVKSLAGDKFKATFDQLKQLVDRQVALGALMALSMIPTMKVVLVKSEGEQKEKDEKRLLDIMKANFDDAAVILGL